jgi:hypothetical protein
MGFLAFPAMMAAAPTFSMSPLHEPSVYMTVSRGHT